LQQALQRELLTTQNSGFSPLTLPFNPQHPYQIKTHYSQPELIFMLQMIIMLIMALLSDMIISRTMQIFIYSAF